MTNNPGKFFISFLFLLLLIPMLTQGVDGVPLCPVTGSGGFVKVPCLNSTSGPAGKVTFGALVTDILDILLALVGSVSVLFLIIGGYRYITAYGNEEQAEAAKRMMTNAVMGLVIVVLSFTLVIIIVNILGGVLR